MANRFKPKSDFGRNVFALLTGTTISQLIPVIVSPLLTRIYSPEDFGIFAIYISLVTLLSVIAMGKYDLSIILPSKNTQAMNLLVLSFVLVILFFLTSLAIIHSFKEEIEGFFKMSALGEWLYIVPFSVLFIGLYNITHMWSNRDKKYHKMSNALILQSSSNASFNLLFGVLNFHSIGLIISNLIGYFFSVYYLARKTVNFRNVRDAFNVKIMLELLIRYKGFPLHTMPQSFVSQGSIQLPIFFIGAFFSSATLGFYSLAYRILGMPLSIVSNSIGSVVYQKSSEMYGNNNYNLQKFITKLALLLLSISFTLGITIVYFLPGLFAWVFGEQWIRAGEIAQILMIYFVFNFALSPFSKIYLVAKQNLFYLKWELFRFVSLAGFMVIYYQLGTINEDLFFLLFSAINLLLYVFISIPIFNKNSFLWLT